jgi:hypothetical protein
MLPSLSFAPLEFCLGMRPTHAERSPPDRNTFGSATLATRAIASAGPTPRQLIEPTAGFVGAVPCVDLGGELQDLSFELSKQRNKSFKTRTRDLGNAIVALIGDDAQ